MDIAQLGMAIDTRDVDRGTRQVKGFASETQKAGRAVGTATSAMAKNWKVAAAAVAATVVVMRTLAGSITILRQFENSMSQVGAISRASAVDLMAMRDIAKDLGSTTEFSASQAADGMRFLAMAGFDARQSMAAIPQVLDLATASGMGLATAADIASNIMSAFGVAAEDAAQVTDALAAVSSRANTSVEQLGDAMKFVGPVASAVGKGINETAAALGVLSDNGLQGSLAGTGLRKVMSSLLNPTNEAADALQRLGVNLEDVNPNTQELTDIVDTLASAGLSAADALTIFGDRGGPAILALVGNNQRLKDLTSEMQNVEGAASDMATTMRDNLEGDAMSLRSAIEGLIIAIGDAGLTAALRTLIQVTTTVVRGFTAMVDAIAALPGYVGEFLGMGAAQRELADAANAVTVAMNEEIAKSDVLNGTLSEGRTMSVETARVKLVQAQAHLSTADAMRQEAVEQVKLSQEYQRIKLAADGARNMVASLQAQADQGILPESGVVNLQRALNTLRASTTEMQRLEEEAGQGSEEFEAAKAEVERLKTAIENADGEMVTLGGNIVTATGNAAGLTAQLQAAALAARGAASSLAGGRSSGAGGRMVGGYSFERQTIQEQGDAMDPDSGDGGGFGGGGLSDSDQAQQQAAQRLTQLLQSQWTEQQKLNFELERYRTLMNEGTISADQFGQAQTVLQQQMAENQFANTTQQIENLSAGLMQAEMNGENLGEALVQMLAQMAVQWLSAAIAAKAADMLSGGILSASMAMMNPGAGGGGVQSLFGFANGTNDAPGGMALVGERGPEIVNLPKGSQVIPNDRTNNALHQMQPNVNVQPATPEVVVLDDPRKIDEYRTSPRGEKARARANRRLQA